MFKRRQWATSFWLLSKGCMLYLYWIRSISITQTLKLVEKSINYFEPINLCAVYYGKNYGSLYDPTTVILQRWSSSRTNHRKKGSGSHQIVRSKLLGMQHLYLTETAHFRQATRRSAIVSSPFCSESLLPLLQRKRALNTLYSQLPMLDDFVTSQQAA